MKPLSIPYLVTSRDVAAWVVSVDNEPGDRLRPAADSAAEGAPHLHTPPTGRAPVRTRLALEITIAGWPLGTTVRLFTPHPPTRVSGVPDPQRLGLSTRKYSSPCDTRKREPTTGG